MQMCDVNFEWRDDDPTYVPGVTEHSYLDDPRDPMEILSDQTFLDWREGKDLQ
jgi:hypothetical protein